MQANISSWSIWKDGIGIIIMIRIKLTFTNDVTQTYLAKEIYKDENRIIIRTEFGFRNFELKFVESIVCIG